MSARMKQPTTSVVFDFGVDDYHSANALIQRYKDDPNSLFAFDHPVVLHGHNDKIIEARNIMHLRGYENLEDIDPVWYVGGGGKFDETKRMLEQTGNWRYQPRFNDTHFYDIHKLQGAVQHMPPLPLPQANYSRGNGYGTESDDEELKQELRGGRKRPPADWEVHHRDFVSQYRLDAEKYAKRAGEDDMIAQDLFRYIAEIPKNTQMTEREFAKGFHDHLDSKWEGKYAKYAQEPNVQDIQRYLGVVRAYAPLKASIKWMKSDYMDITGRNSIMVHPTFDHTPWSPPQSYSQRP